MATVDNFLIIDGIKGEAQDSKMALKGAIDIESFSWGEVNTPYSGTARVGSGRGSGKVVMRDFQFVAKTSKASPELMLSCAEGRHIKKAELICRKAGKDQQEFLTITMSDLLVSSYETSCSDLLPNDVCTLAFTKIEYSYKPQKADGNLDAAVKGGWDLGLNKKA